MSPRAALLLCCAAACSSPLPHLARGRASSPIVAADGSAEDDPGVESASSAPADGGMDAMLFGTQLQKSNQIWAPGQIPDCFAAYHADDMQTAVDITGAQSGFVPRLGANVGAWPLITGNSTSPIYDPNALAPGRGSLVFSSARTTLLLPAGTPAAADWAFLSNGLGGAAAFLAKPTGSTANQTLVNTSGTAFGAGVQIEYDGSLQCYRAFIRNASTQIALIEGAAGSSPRGNLDRVVFVYSETMTPKVKLFVNGVLVANGTTSPASPATTPASFAVLGRFASANLRFFEGAIHVPLFYSRAITDAEVASITANLPNYQSPRPIRRIWAVGDSLTAADLQLEQLFKRHLVNTKMQINFLGSLLAGEIASFVARNVDGYVANTIQQIQAHVDGLALPHEPTDILLMAGTNNVLADMPTTQAAFASLVTTLHTQHPTATMWLGRPPRYLHTIGGQTWMETYAAFVQSYALANGFNYGATDVNNDSEIGPDGIHCTNAGYAVIGDHWADAMGL